LLRFSPGPGGVHIARYAPDHFVLPGHFTIRFGEAAWAIIDERRGLALALACDIGAGARLVPLEETPHSIAAPGRDPWEDLWRSYHKVIANEGRSNPRLQNQFMPRRYLDVGFSGSRFDRRSPKDQTSSGGIANRFTKPRRRALYTHTPPCR
jgi:probable DNA metabolism protein